MRYRKHLVGTLLFTFILLAVALQQAAKAQSTTNPLVAYVYVSTSPTTATFEIKAYAAYANGSLATVSGSPFAAEVQYMALNGLWLFGTDGINIHSFKIESSGALHPAESVNAQQFNLVKDGGPQNLVLDHTGKSLYDGDIYIDGANNGYQSWNVVETTGQIDFTGLVGPYSPSYGNPLSFIHNNVYAYSSSCIKGDPIIYGYKRGTTGKLTFLNIRPSIPRTNIAGSGYCPYLAAADTSDHVAISLTPFAPYSNVGPPQIAVYTASSTGSLTTTSTATNMPKSSVVNVTDMKMAPSGRLLAVAGSAGLQVFHFNGANPVTKYTGRLTTNPVDQVFWDNANHLYAVSKKAGKLYVFTVTPNYVAPAPGSPHSIYHPQNLAVLPKT